MSISPEFLKHREVRSTLRIVKIGGCGMPTAGDRIREIREELGWTLDKLVEKTGISKGFLSDVETGKRDISSEYLLKIADAMEASVDYLLRGDNSASPANKPKPVE